MKLTAPDPTPLPLDHLTLRGDAAAPALLTREGVLDYAGLEDAVVTLTVEQLNWLLDGLDVFRQPHRLLRLAHVS